MIAFLVAAGDVSELKTPPNFGFHALKGNRTGTCAMTVTKNWRLTFKVNRAGAIVDLDLEDYY
jgi:proteic killer suppression protein